MTVASNTSVRRFFPMLLLSLGVLAGCGRTALGPDRSTGAVAGMAPQAASELSSPAGLSRVELNTEQYDAVVENPFTTALTEPQSTFSIDVDTASYANVRRMLQAGELPPSGAVRIEELINYFNYQYPEPNGEHPFSVATELAPCPWQPQHQLLRVGLKGKSLAPTERPDCNLVFLLDVSGSMLDAKKLPLVKSALQLLTGELKARDRVAIVVYAGAAGMVLDSTSAQRRADILAAIDNLTAGGSTNGGAGIQLAYRIAEENFIEEGVNRVILCTDGDFNVGTTNDSDLVELVQEKARTNVFLSVLGFGSGNLKDSTMERLADRGNGNYAYIDSLLEARKVLVEQIGGTLVTIAKDVKIQLDFNPQHVQSYRLLGYENRLLANQDFRDDAKDAGEIGAGHTVTAFYEIVPATGAIDAANSATSDARPSEFVKSELSQAADPSTLLTVNLRYKQPEAQESSEFQVRLSANSATATPSEDFQFASAVVAYGLLLRDSKLAGAANWDWVVDTANNNIGDDPSGMRHEFVQLAKTARRIVVN